MDGRGGVCVCKPPLGDWVHRPPLLLHASQRWCTIPGSKALSSLAINFFYSALHVWSNIMTVRGVFFMWLLIPFRHNCGLRWSDTTHHPGKWCFLFLIWWLCQPHVIMNFYWYLVSIYVDLVQYVYMRICFCHNSFKFVSGVHAITDKLDGIFPPNVFCYSLIENIQ